MTRYPRCRMGSWIASVGVLLAGPYVIYPLRAEPDWTNPPPTSQPTTRPVRSTVIDEQLVKKLLGGQSSAVDTVEATLMEMDRAAKQLSEEHNVGPQTQVAQRRVVEGIDQLIDQAQRNRASRTAPPTGKRQSERRGADAQRQRGSASGRPGEPGPVTKGGRGAPGGGEDSVSKSDFGGKSEFERGWGFLPPRDRAEISQGFDVEFHSKYREEIIRYYRSLAEAAQEAPTNEKRS